MNQQINLYQPMFRKQEKVFSAVTMLQITGFIVLVLAAIYGYSLYSLQPFKSELAKIDSEHNKLEQQLSRLEAQAPANVKSQLLEDEVRQLTQELEQKQRVQEMLTSGRYGNRDGFSGLLEGLARQHVSGLWLTQVRVTSGGTQLMMSGKANSAELIPIYIQKLAAETAFAKLSFNVLQISRSESEDGMVEFNLATQLDTGKG
ncbi:MAG: PilN domain-containing protein [Gammaproteobacteria bacterium]